MKPVQIEKGPYQDIQFLTEHMEWNFQDTLNHVLLETGLKTIWRKQKPDGKTLPPTEALLFRYGFLAAYSARTPEEDAELEELRKKAHALGIDPEWEDCTSRVKDD